MKTGMLLTISGIMMMGAGAFSAPKSTVKKAVHQEKGIYRSTAVEEISTAPAPKPSRNTKNVFPKVSVDELRMRFEDPNPPAVDYRSYYIGLSMGSLSSKGSVESSTGDVFEIGEYGATNSFGLSFGGSRRTGTQSDEMAGTWKIGFEGKVLYSRQTLKRDGFIPDGSYLQSTLLGLQPWVSRRFESVPRATALVGAEFGYFQYTQSSTLTSFRFTKAAPIAGLELAMLYDLSKNWAAKAQFNTRTKISGDALELPEAAWALGGRYQW